MSSPNLLEDAKEHLGVVRQSLLDTQAHLVEQFKKLKTDFIKAKGADQISLHALLEYTKKRQHELSSLYPSPFFSRCDFSSSVKDSVFYIGKFSFPEKSVVSWIAPISTLRFSKPGNTTYTVSDNIKKEVRLKRKDEYMIKDGEIMFFATESENQPRTLVYQEHFSNRKTGFVLPEIISKMEEAQDKVIRCAWQGPLVISGPAGSGKTTLALHRIAYLMQVPEISNLFPAHRIRVFVQDNGTKSYFNTLLPDLGIDNVEIITFKDWGRNILAIPENNQKPNFESEQIEDAIIFEKLNILRKTNQAISDKPLDTLKKIYKNNLQNNLNLVLERLDNNILDDIDFTILLQAYKKSHGTLRENREYFVQQKDKYEVKRKLGWFDISYNLCVVDEFQNYLPEQLQLIRDCINEETKSIIYVGDMGQQTHFGTIKSWQQIDENINDSRSIVLGKVYRNTKQILKYIQSRGYQVSIPNELEEGEPVKTLLDTEQTRDYLSNFATEHTDRLIGILAKNNHNLLPYKHLENQKHIKILTIAEAQGVEFDTVFLIDDSTLNKSDLANYPPEMIAEKEKINKDLLYVALTRAMKELVVIK